MRVVIYCRVSTKGQEEDGTSLDTQEERCRAYAAERGWEVMTVYRETHTGGDLWERPLLSELRELVRSSAVDVVLAYALDRLSRKQTHIAIIAEEIERAGARLVFVTEDFEQSATGTFLRSAKAFAAELEREKIRERTQRGLLARAKSGKLRPSNRPLYGYQWADDSKGAYVIDPQTAPIVRRIFEMSADGTPLRGIARLLNESGVPTPNGGLFWKFIVIRQILHHDGYTGVAFANRYAYVTVNGVRKRVERPVEEHIALPKGTIPPIVTPELYEIAQARLARNKAEATRNSRDPEAFLLRSGFVFCGCCGKRIHTGWYKARAGKPPRPFYGVAQSVEEHHGCPFFRISAPRVDEAVWQKVRALVLQPDIVKYEVERLRTADPTSDSLVTVEGLLAEAIRKRDNLTRALANIDDPDVQKSVLAELKAVSQSVRDLNAERDTLIAGREAWRASQVQVDDLRTWLSAVSTNIDTLTYQQKRDLLAALDVRVLLYPQNHTPRYTISASLPLDVADTSIVYSPR